MILFISSISFAQSEAGVDPIESEKIRIALDSCYRETGLKKPDYFKREKMAPAQADLKILNDCLAIKGFPIPKAEEQN